MRLSMKLLLLTSILTVTAGCAGGITAFNKAEKLERQGKLDEAVIKYAEAMTANPGMGEYRAKFLNVSEKAARVHLDKGMDYMAAARYDDAIREFQTAFTLDASLDRARQMSSRALKLRDSRRYFSEGAEFEKERKLREALSAYRKAAMLDPEFKEAVEAADRVLKNRKSKLDGFELNLKSTKPITLKFRDAKIKEVFNILSQLSGINFVFDDGVKDQNVTVFLENATFYQAMEILTGMHKLGRKVLNESTIIIYPKTPDKEKQYEDLKVQTFQLNKLDAKKAVNLIRTMLPAKKIYVNEDINALVMRDTPESLAVASRILEANDIPDAEVVLETEIIEISKSNEENFGLLLSKYAVQAAAGKGSTLLSDVMVTPTTSSTSSSTSTSTSTTTSSTDVNNLLQLFSMKGFSGFFTVPSATYNFAKTLANGQTLSNPKIRVKNREKAKFTVGQRIPITTTSSTTVGGTSVNVQYVDVGVKMNAEPVIQLDNDITIKVSLEVSNGTVRTLGDNVTQVVDINNRNLDTVLSLKDGETSIIGGLIQRIGSDTKSKISFLGDIPIIGKLLSNDKSSNQKNEVILAITPHIVRGITVPDEEVSSFWSGKEDDPSLTNPYGSFVEEPDLAAPQPVFNAAPVPAPPRPAVPATQGVPAPPSFSPAPQGAATAPAGGSPAAVTTPGMPTVPAGAVPSGRHSPATAPMSSAGAVNVPGAPVSAARGPISLNISAPNTVRVNDRFNINIVASNATDLMSAPFVVTYDPSLLDYEGASEGSFMKRDGKQTIFQATGEKSSGQISVNLTRSGNSGGISGSGSLAILSFRAKAPGAANFAFTKSAFADPAGKPLVVAQFKAVSNVIPLENKPAAK